MQYTEHSAKSYAVIKLNKQRVFSNLCVNTLYFPNYGYYKGLKQ